MSFGVSPGQMSFRRPGWLESSLWGLGLVLITVFVSTRVWSEYARVQAIEAFRAIDPSRGPPELAPAGGAGIDQSLWSRARIRAYSQSARMPGAPAALLRIPSLQLEVPVYGALSELNLNRGAAHIEGTADLSRSGNIGIAGHRDGFFRKLKDIAVGADVYLDVERRTTRFRVVKLSVVEPSDVRVLAPSRYPSITLVTCYPFYFVGPAPQRFIVRAEIDTAADARGSSGIRAHPTS